MKYVIFDTETTGIRSGKDDVIQLAYIVLDDNMDIIDCGCDYCNTDVPISSGAYDVHHIDKKFLETHAGSVFLNDIIMKNKYFRPDSEEKDVVFIAYNASFDINMINKKLKARGYRGVYFGGYTKTPNDETSGRHHFCLMRGIQYKKKLRSPQKLLDVRKEILTNLSEDNIKMVYNHLSKPLNLPTRGERQYHDALYDTLVTALIYSKVRKWF